MTPCLAGGECWPSLHALSALDPPPMKLSVIESRSQAPGHAGRQEEGRGDAVDCLRLDAVGPLGLAAEA